MGIDFFTNDRFKVLFCMAERQIEVKNKIFVPLSQQEISEVVGISKKTVNTIIKELKENGYIIQQSSTRGKYLLTEKAKKQIEKIKS